MTDEKKTELEAIIEHIREATTAGSITHQQVGQAFDLLKEMIFAVEESIPSLPDLTPYAKVQALTNLRTSIFIELAKYYTKTEIDSRQYVTSSDLNSYATISRMSQAINSAIADFVTMEQVEAMIPSLAGYAKTADVDAKTAKLATKTALADAIKDFVTLAQVKALLPSLESYALKLDIPDVSGFAKQVDLNKYAKLTDLPSLEGYARKSEIPSVEGLATTLDLLGYMPIEEAHEFHDGIEQRVRDCEEKTKHLGVVPYSHGSADSLVNTAKYFCAEDVQNVPSLPCYVEVMGHDGQFIVQRAITKDGSVKQRVFNGSAWGEWKNF